jgi:hypothetical protein
MKSDPGKLRKFSASNQNRMLSAQNLEAETSEKRRVRDRVSEAVSNQCVVDGIKREMSF